MTDRSLLPKLGEQQAAWRPFGGYRIPKSGILARMTHNAGGPSGTTRPLRSDIESLIAPSQSDVLERLTRKAARDAGIDSALLAGFLEAALEFAGLGRRLGRLQLDTCRQQGGAAADQGIALSSLLDLYLSALWRLWDDISGRVHSVDSRVVAAAAAGLFRAADDAAEALAEGYEKAQRLSVRRDNTMRREFVDDLLSGVGKPDLVRERAARFGFNLAGTHVVTVARTHRVLDDAGPVHARIESHLFVTFGGRDVVVATKDGALVCVVPVSAAEPVADLARALEGSGEGPWQIGVGRPYVGQGGLVRSYNEARESLDLASRLNLTDGIVRYESLLPYRVLSLDPITLAEMVRAVLGPLDEARGGREPLITTLAAYFAESGNVSASARRLHLSPRAVVYRLERITALTGYAADDPEGRFVLEMAVRATRMLETDKPAGESPSVPKSGNQERRET